MDCQVVDVKRVNERRMCLKVLVSEWTSIYAYAPQMGRSAEEKDCFTDQMLSVVETYRHRS